MCGKPATHFHPRPGPHPSAPARPPAAPPPRLQTMQLPLCHTCRIVKPLRSKHCQKLKRCKASSQHQRPVALSTCACTSAHFLRSSLLFFEGDTAMKSPTTTWGVFALSSGSVCSFVRCVPVFDHHCPYVGNTLGAGNYRSFVIFMWFGFFGVAGTAVAAFSTC